MAHVADYKKKIVDSIVKLVKEYPIIGAVNMENLPAPQLQKMRAQLRGKVDMAMTKRRIMKIALEKVKNDKKGIEKLEDHLKGMPALIFTKDSPFKLSKVLMKNKSKAPAKAGQTAPNDIMVNKGPTSFAPGPIIGELSMAGIKSGVEGGKVAIKEDTVVVKQGEQIQPKVAEILTRLGVEPMEVGLDLTAAYEDGLIYTKDVLTIDEQEYLDRLNNAARNSFNLAFEIAYTTKDNISLFISKAYNDSKALGLGQEILDEGIVQELIEKAERSMLGLKGSVNLEEPVKEEKAEETSKVEEKPEVKEEKKPEVKKEEPKVEEKKVEQPKEEIKEAPKVEPKSIQKEPAPKEVPKPEPEVLKKEPETKPDVPEKKVEPEIKKEAPKPEVKEEKPKIEETPKPEVKEIPKPEPVKEDSKKIEEKKEPVKEVKPEIKQEVPKVEPLKEVKPQLKPEELKEKPNTDKKVEDMVKRTKEFMSGKEVTADNIMEEVEKEVKVEKKEEKKEEVPTAEELKKKKKKSEQEEVEDLTKELMKKGTLRKK